VPYHYPPYRHSQGSAIAKLELKGGSKENHAEAREWMFLFWHEAVVREN
jgi:hypothetical protein